MSPVLHVEKLSELDLIFHSDPHPHFTSLVLCISYAHGIIVNFSFPFLDLQLVPVWGLTRKLELLSESLT